jgi:glutamine amidotransferase
MAWEAMSECGRERSGKDVGCWITQVQELGAGEILITSVDQDGTCAGPDKDLEAFAATVSRVPLVISGGYASEEQVINSLEQTFVSAVCIGAALHKGKLDLSLLKHQCKEADPEFRLRVPENVIHNSPSHYLSLAGRNIGIVDYGMGNQQSLQNAFEVLGANVCISADVVTLEKCELLALPGVGSFPQGMNNLIERGLDTFLIDWASHNRPLIGICLGMQMLFKSSEEFCSTHGLSLFDGHVISLPPIDKSGSPLLLPHIGWNSIFSVSTGFKPLSNPLSYQYFVHTYVASCLDPSDILFYSKYGGHLFVSAVQRGSVIGFQFHPERSGSDGLALLSLKCQELFSFSDSL